MYIYKKIHLNLFVIKINICATVNLIIKIYKFTYQIKIIQFELSK